MNTASTLTRDGARFTSELASRLVGSPCCLPRWPLHKLLPVYSMLGFTKLEGFTEWVEAKLDWRQEPVLVRSQTQEMGLTISSFQLPYIQEGAEEQGLAKAVAAAEFAAHLGAKVVIFKAANRRIYKALGRKFLDELELRQLNVTPLLQNHLGTAISSLEDFMEVLALLDYDPRMKAVLEIGHFHRVGVNWQTAWENLADRVALVHVNDILEGNSVPYGTGEVDFPTLVQRLKNPAYTGDIVVDLELPTRNWSHQETVEGLRSSLEYLHQLYS